ncbi:small basic protein [Lacunimicrobium album]
MSINKTLKIKNTMVRARNVLKRVERIAGMKENESWKDGQAPIHLPKFRVLKSALGKKKKAAGGDKADDKEKDKKKK